ncbi:GNAT domain-containing protein [Vararia minispora EC-137]|uniref:GNAT domain-containing protein n=1 Tax=Vararia minispora EC-137 TaxID=1314806 RepID=A0ACB8QL91_9AGAM|nr:GNAT domain-containing protein [Vararia minispora EC-137]
MKINANTVLVGARVVLVPYREEHVERYHAWMQDADLRAQTASEPLSLEEEYAMQRSWAEDDDKLTFIVLARTPGTPDVLAPDAPRALPMVGDVNLFLKGALGDDDFEAEAEVMIAEKEYRRKGLAREALALLFRYATATPTPEPTAHAASSPLGLPPSALVARIGAENDASRALFASLGFRVRRAVPVFDELELAYGGGAEWESEGGAGLVVCAYDA